MKLKIILWIILALLLNFIIYEIFIGAFVYKSIYKEYEGYRFAREEGTDARGMYEGYFKGEINEFGSTLKIEYNDKSRILVLGDSFTEAENIFPDDHFISKLNGEFGSLQFINMSRSGGNFADYIKADEFYSSISNTPYSYIFIYLSYSDFLDSYNNTKGHFTIDDENNIKYVKFIDSDLRSFLLKTLNTSSSLGFFVDKLNRIVKSGNFNVFAGPPEKKKKSSYINYGGNLTEEEIEKIKFQLNEFNNIYGKERVTFLLPTKFSEIDYVNGLRDPKLDDIIHIFEEENFKYIDIRKDFVDDYLSEKRYTSHGFYNAQIRSGGHINTRGHDIIFSKLKEYINNNKQWFLQN